MKTTLTISAVLCLIAGSALAQDATCAAQASGKKLAGAALASFAKKCCDTQAADKKLSGASKTSFTTKCMKDAGAS